MKEEKEKNNRILKGIKQTKGRNKNQVDKEIKEKRRRKNKEGRKIGFVSRCKPDV